SHQLWPCVRLGISSTVPGVSSRGLSRLLASAIGRHWVGSLYCCQAISLRVCPCLTCTYFVTLLLYRGVSWSCSSIVQASRNETFSFARSGTPRGAEKCELLAHALEDAPRRGHPAIVEELPAVAPSHDQPRRRVRV